MVIALLILFSTLTFAERSEAVKIYDIQCGCYANPRDAARLVLRLKDRGLSWYSIRIKPCTRFIFDANVDYRGRAFFIRKYPEFSDAFLVKNFWDLPHPHPMRISPVPTAEEFITIMAPYMQRQYHNGYYNQRRLVMAEERAQMYTRFIYEASRCYRIDPFLLFAVGNFETYFYNTFGDLDRLKYRHPDPAQGMFQILRSTARVIYHDMRKQNLPHAPREFPGDLRIYPKAQIYFAAHYLRDLHQKHYGNRYMALLAYNGTKNPNYDYPRKVMRFYQRAIRHFIISSNRYNSEGKLAAKAPHPGHDQKQKE